MSKDKLIPELRFPEFDNEGKWVEKRISELGETINGLTGKSGADFGAGSPFVTYKQVFDKSNIDFEKCGKVQVSDNENQNTLGIGDILFTTSSETPNEVGFASVLIKAPKEATYLNSFCFALRPFNIEETQPQFSQYLFHSPGYRKSVTTIAQGSTRYNISKGAFLNLKLPIPNPKEQQKIASCLSSLDEVIAAHSQKLEVLKDHKKGLMQNLFPQRSLNCDSSDSYDENDLKNQDNQANQKNHSSDNIPKYRFKEFENDGEWVFEPFHKVYSFLVTNSFSREFLNYNNGAVKNIHYGDIHTKFSTLFDLTKESVPFINPEVSIERIREECYCIEGDIIFADASEDLNDVGKSIEIVKLNGEKLVSGLHTLMARQVVRKIEIGFGGYLFKSDRIRKQIQKESQGTKVLSISGTRISNIKIFYPKNPQEQKKIASCLSSLDALITAQAEKIEQLKLHKKGLMQGLFPKFED